MVQPVQKINSQTESSQPFQSKQTTVWIQPFKICAPPEYWNQATTSKYTLGRGMQRVAYSVIHLAVSLFKRIQNVLKTVANVGIYAVNHLHSVFFKKKDIRPVSTEEVKSQTSEESVFLSPEEESEVKKSMENEMEVNLPQPPGIIQRVKEFFTNLLKKQPA